MYKIAPERRDLRRNPREVQRSLFRLARPSSVPSAYLVLYLAVFAASFFVIPYAFRVPPSVSASYVYQFNNRVATAIFVAGTAGFCWLVNGLNLPIGEGRSRVALWARWLGIIWCAAIALMLSAAAVHQPLAGEAIYFLDRLNHLNAQQSIYRDFEFPYGPLPLYLPFWTGKLLHLTLRQGYSAVWILIWAVGAWILSVIVDAIEIAAPNRTAVFLVLISNIYPALWAYGINFSPLRFLLTGSVALLVFRVQQRRGVRWGLATAIPAAALAAAVSPEFGIAFILGTLTFFVVFVHQRPRGFWLSYGITVFAFAGIVLTSFRTGVYTTMHAMGSGAYNYPILPGPINLLVMFVYIVAACAGYAAYRARHSQSLLLYILCISLFCMPSCFGRADAGHMEFGAMSAFVVGVLAISTRRVLWIPLVIPFVVLSFLGVGGLFGPPLTIIRESAERALFRPGEASTAASSTAAALFRSLHMEGKLQRIQSKQAEALHRETVKQPLQPLPPGPVYLAPLGYDDSKQQIDMSGQVDYGYFHGLEDVFLPAEVEGMVRWMRLYPDRPLVLPPGWQNGCYTFEEASAENMRSIYLFPYVPPQRRVMKVFYPLCDYIQAHYSRDPMLSRPNWSIWRRTTTAP